MIELSLKSDVEHYPDLTLLKAFFGLAVLRNHEHMRAACEYIIWRRMLFSSFVGLLESNTLSDFFGVKLLRGVVWNGLNLCSILARNYFWYAIRRAHSTCKSLWWLKGLLLTQPLLGLWSGQDGKLSTLVQLCFLFGNPEEDKLRLQLSEPIGQCVWAEPQRNRSLPFAAASLKCSLPVQWCQQQNCF